MKTKIALPTILFLVASGFIYSQNAKQSQEPLKSSTTGSIRLFCTPALFPLTSMWAAEYNKINPETKIQVKKVLQDEIANNVNTPGNIGLISEGYKVIDQNEPGWKIVVGRNVIVPVMNASNPYLAEIALEGISSKSFANVFTDPGNKNWSKLVKNGSNVPVHIYMVNDLSVQLSVAKFLGTDQLPLTGINVVNSDELVTAIQKEPLAIGFCKMTSVLNPENENIISHIQLLPIDKNGNGTIDNMENIYSDVNTFMRGVWIGKYPKALNTEIYSVSGVQPKNETVTAFLAWIITSGQQFLNSNGFCDLQSSEKQTQLDKIMVPDINTASSDTGYFRIGLALLILATLLVLGFILNALVWHFKSKRISVTENLPVSPSAFNQDTLLIPNGLYYDKTHTWAFMEKDGAVKIGIDDFLQHVTGAISRIDMRKNGEKIKKGERILSIIQNGKQLNIYSPVSGIIKEQNTGLITQASMLNSSPYSDGWVYMVEPSN